MKVTNAVFVCVRQGPSMGGVWHPLHHKYVLSSKVFLKDNAKCPVRMWCARIYAYTVYIFAVTHLCRSAGFVGANNIWDIGRTRVI